MAKLNPGTRIYGTGTVDSTLFVNGVSAASSTATGALRVLGGVGVAAGVFVGGAVTATNIFGSSEVAVGSGNFVSLAGQGGPTRIRRDGGNNGLDLQTNSVSRLFIADAGNVGIGIVNPGSFELLTVGGSIRTTLDNSAIVSGNDGQLGFVKKSGFNATISSVIGVPIIFNRLNTSTAITSAAVVANTLTEYMRITPNGGVSFGISGTAFGTAGQVLQSNGDAPPTWVNTSSGGGGSLIGGSSGQIPYMTGPNTTGFSGNLAWNSSTNILGVTGTVQASVFSRTGNVNSPLWTTTSPWFNVASNVLTDTTAAAGTTSSRVGISFLSPNFAANNAITVTDAVNLYVQAPVASTNVTITNNWGIYNQGGMYVNGNFGLGTTQYGTSKLSVNGSLTVNANDSFFGNFASGDYVDVGNLGATGNVYFDARGASTNVGVNYRSKGVGTHIWTYNGGSNESMRIDGSGNVAINSGTTNARLLVFAPSTTAPSLTFGAAAGQIFRNEFAELAVGLSNASPFSLYIQGRYTSNVSHPIVINPLGGNVGIGTTSSIQANFQIGSSSALTNYQGAPVGIMLPTGSGSWLELAENTTNGTSFRISKDASTGVVINTNVKDLGFKADAYGTAISGAQIVLKTNGDVGIGYTSAQSGAKLSVNGAGFFNGIVTATTVVVSGAGGDITGATNITASGLITGGSFLSTAATTATSTATGALQVRGGVGIGGNLFVGNLTNGSTANVLYYNASTKEISYAALVGSSSASSLAGGTSGQIPYQTGPSTTAFMANANWNSSTSVLSVTGTMQATVFSRTGNVNSPLWTTTSPWFNVAGNILTDTTAPAGTTSSRVGISFLSPNFASTNAITITDAVNLYVQAPVASTNVTITNNWGIYNQGNSYVNGNERINGSLGVGTAPSGTTGEIRATNEITAYYSDRRLKENVKIIDGAVAKVQSLHGITYTPNELAESFGYLRTTKLVGLFADEVEAVLPEATRPAPFDVDETGASKSGENYKTIQYEKLVPLLVEAIKEQQLAIDLLKYELQELKNSNK